jgi:hypothetical protein
MRFLLRLANQKDVQPRNARELASSSYQAVRKYGADVGNLRVSSKAIELDLLLPSKDNLREATQALESKLGPLLTIRELDTQPALLDSNQAIREGIELFNEERYWESHEALEAAWHQTSGAEKEILQGIILVAAAFVHLQKNEKTVALSIMGRAREKLKVHRGEHFGIDLDSLSGTLSGMVEAGQLEFIRIRVKSHGNRATA